MLGVSSDAINRIAHTLNVSDSPPPVKCAEYISAARRHFICDHCFTRFQYKDMLIYHLATCTSEREITCDICKIKFTNMGNLARHASAVHCDKTYNKTDKKYQCAACDKSFTENWTLTQHVRRMHFNLSHETYTHSTKSVNEVWVEKVSNSDVLIEMKKSKKNVIVMKKCDSSTSEEPVKIPEYRPDLESVYKTDKKRVVRVKCEFCDKYMFQKSLKKHINERHRNYKAHKCANCDYKCKRPYLMLKHICGQAKKTRNRPI